MTTGPDLRRARQQLGVSLEAIAAESGRSKGHLSRVELGERPLTPSLLHAYETVLNLGAQPPVSATFAESGSLPPDDTVTIYPHRSAVPWDLWDRQLARANNRIEVLCIAALFLVERPDFARHMRARAGAGVEVRMLFGDSAAEATAVRSRDEGLGPETVAARIGNALRFVRPIAGVDRVDIRQHGTTLYNSVFRSDDSMIVNLHAYGIPGAHAPVLHFTRAAAPDLFDTYTGTFENVWAQSSPLEP
ncbi:MAG TPA: helix-turn-helix transcriptional regulator [Jiangellaceae bacterium]